MVIISPNLEYGPYEDHTFTNLTSPSSPSTQLIHLPHDGFVKSCNDQSMLSHTTFKIPPGILYISQ
jgi:hypothetical protein